MNNRTYFKGTIVLQLVESVIIKVVKYVDFLQKNTAYWGFKINTSQYATIRSILGVVKYVQQYA